MEKVIITGVAGFIGSYVARRFIKEGVAVVGVDDFSNGKSGNVPDGITFIEGDLSKSETINLIPKKCTKILHLAGQSSGEISFDDPIADLHKNTISTLNLIKYGIENKSKRIVYASSMSVYGSVDDKPVSESQVCTPLSCYGVGKLASEGYLKVYHKSLPYVSLRMFNVYGPGQDLENLRQGMVSIYLAQALENGNIEVKGSIERFRDFIYIDDVVEVWWRAAMFPSALNKTFNVATGKRTTVAQLLENICGLIPGSRYFIKGTTPGDQNGIYADVSQLKKEFQISEFIQIEKGIPIFLNSAKNIDKGITK